MTTFIIFSSSVFILAILGGITEGKLDAIYGTNPDHKKDFLWRVAIGAVVSTLVNRTTFWPLIPKDNWWLYDKPFICVVGTVLMLVASGMLYGFFLNISHNKVKGKPLDYIGNTAEIDKKARKLGFKDLNVMMLIGGLLFVFFYYVWAFNSIG